MLHILVRDDVKPSAWIELVGHVVCNVIAEFYHDAMLVGVKIKSLRLRLKEVPFSARFDDLATFIFRPFRQFLGESKEIE